STPSSPKAPPHSPTPRTSPPVDRLHHEKGHDLVVDGTLDPNTLARQVWSAIANEKLIHNS
ncbi:hypothetical protein ACFXKC_56910, partial [Streptomyces sp. NPDC059340]|uniref:hypothetical protein n=1 Tax=Streptomyces sp. NPDC059340 TaxID=3346806 RepID=UPI00368BFA21